MEASQISDDPQFSLFSKKRKRKSQHKAAKIDVVQPKEPPVSVLRSDASEGDSALEIRAETEDAASCELATSDAPIEPSANTASVRFKDLGLTDWLDRVCTSLGMTIPTQVQQGCIPKILEGRDIIGTAHTGSGKTAAFALPILQALAKDPFGVFALVLTPTRELAVQLAEQFRALAAGMAFKDAVVIGGLEMQAQARALARRPHVVVATPGRLKELIVSNSDLAAGFSRARFLVLDEADQLLQPSFQEELRAIIEHLPASRQTLLFSATMTKSLVALQSTVLKDAFCFQAYEGLQTVSQLREQYLFIPAKVKEVYLAHLLQALPQFSVTSAMIFVGTCRAANLLSLVLEELGIRVAALHSHLTQGRRLAALDRFKSGAVPILIATDIASRGLDIPTVDLVINFDLPLMGRDYVHRVGRTARAGRGGWALSIVSQYDVELVQQIEELTGSKMSAFELEEAEVLKGITKVFAAKRVAAMKVAEHEGYGTGRTTQSINRSKGAKRKSVPEGLM